MKRPANHRRRRLLFGILVGLFLWVGTGVHAGPGSAAMLHIKFYYDRLSRVDGLFGVEPAVSKLSDFDLIVTREPAEMDSADRQVLDLLIAERKEIYGYFDLVEATHPDRVVAVYLGMTRLSAAGYTGVFFDRAGYDYGVSRQTLNDAVAFAHSRGLRVMLNAWHPIDVLEADVDDLYNPTGTATSLNPGDWVLLESFYARSDDRFAGEAEGGFDPVMEKYMRAVNAAQVRGVRVAALTYHSTLKPLDDQSDRLNSLYLAEMLGLEGWAYGRSDNNDQVPWPHMPRLPWTWNRFCGPVFRLPQLPGLWMRATDNGFYWFVATENPPHRRAGYVSTWDSASPACSP